MNARDGGAEAAIAFVGGEGNHSGIGNEEIRAADSHFGGEKIAAERAAGGGDQLDRIVSIHVAQFLFEKIGDVFAGKVHGRRDDVIGRFVAQLNDIFAEIGLEGLDAGFLEGRRKMNFLGDH